jgi:uridine kinase
LEPYLIAIAGPFWFREKARFAGRVTQLLDGACAMVELDSYYHPQPGLSLEERAHCNYDHPDALDWDLLESHLRALLAGTADRSASLFVRPAHASRCH